MHTILLLLKGFFKTGKYVTATQRDFHAPFILRQNDAVTSRIITSLKYRFSTQNKEQGLNWHRHCLYILSLVISNSLRKICYVSIDICMCLLYVNDFRILFKSLILCHSWNIFKDKTYLLSWNFGADTFGLSVVRLLDFCLSHFLAVK